MDTNTLPKLIHLILNKQGQSSDVKFAKTLDIPRTVWVQAKHGNRQPGLTLIRAILRTYPDLTDEVIAYIKDGNSELT